MATKADKKKWDSLHVAQAKAQAAESAYDLALAQKYHMSYQDSWLTHAQRDKKDRLREKRREIESKILDLLVEISPRGDRWLHGAPAHWLATELTWEDAIRPANEPLSVVVPGSWGSPDGTVRQKRGTLQMPRGIHNDAKHLREILEKGVILDKDRVDGDSIKLDDSDPVYVGIIVDVNGYGPHVGAMYVEQNRFHGSVDGALQGADEILEQWTLDNTSKEDIDELEDEYGDDWMSVLTETFDGWGFKVSASEFAEAIRGTDAEKFVDIEPEEEELEEDDEPEDEEPEDDIFSAEEMQSGFVISDSRNGGYEVAHEHKHIGHYEDMDDALEAIEAEMKRSNFYPNIYYVNDHGNVDLLDGDGNVIESRT
jgi:hypothetical protein